MNNLKSKAGFTLVELIVVIAILAILAGVGTAAYTGYINKAKEAADINTCDAIKTAAVAALSTYGEVTEVKVASGTVTAKYGTSATAVTLNGSDVANETYDDNFKAFYTSTVPSTFANSKNTATWTAADGWKFS